MSLSLVIPVRPPHEGKTRLAAVLDPEERAALARSMFRHVLGVAVAFASPPRCHVVSSSAELLSLAQAAGANSIMEKSRGLNAALRQAAGELPGDGPMMTVSADLPLLTAEDLEAMKTGLRDAHVVLAGDRAGTGTNALLLRRPGLIPFAFGEGSFTRHRALSDAAGCRFARIRRPGLANDIDEPDDLSLLQPREISQAR